MKGHIRERARGTWEITIDIGRDTGTGQRMRHFETFRGRKRDAQSRMAELQLDIEKGAYVRQSRRLTTGVWLSQWLDGRAVAGLSPKTVESYNHELRRYVIPELGHIRLPDLRAQHIRDYMVKASTQGRRLRQGGLSARTVQYHYRILNKALGDAVQEGVLAINACHGVKPPRPIRYDVPHIGPDELEKLIEAINPSSYYLFFYTLLLTGLRRSELLALKWRDVDLELAMMYISHSLLRLESGEYILKEPKTPRSRRMIDLPPSLTIPLRQHKNTRELELKLMGGNLGEDDYMFCQADGSPLVPSTMTHTFGKIMKRAGMPHLRLHDLRHIHATMLLKSGTHPKVVQERLGHSSITTTMDIYSHVVPGLQKAAAERFDLLLPKTGIEINVGKMSARGG